MNKIRNKTINTEEINKTQGNLTTRIGSKYETKYISMFLY